MILNAYLKKYYTAATAAGYEREIDIFLQSCPGAATAGYTDIIAWLGVLRKRYHNGQTLNRILCSIKVYYDYLCYAGIRNDHPAKSIRLRDQRPRDVQLQDLFTAGELELLLERKERSNMLYYRNRVLMGLLVHQALRPQEMALLEATAINLDAGSIYIGSTATTNSRTLSLKPNQVLLLYSYLQGVRPKLLRGKGYGQLLISQRGEPMPVGDIVKHVLRVCREIYPDRHSSAQTIRQSVIANLLAAGHDLRVVQQFAGHKYPSSTERYRQHHVEPLKAAIDQYHPMR